MGLSRQEFCSGLSFPSLGDLPDTEIKPTSPVLAGRFFTTYHLGVKVTQLCLTLCNPMDYTVHEILQARILEGVAFPFSRGSSQPRSPTLKADFLPAEPQGKPKNTEVGSLSLLQGIFRTQELNQGLLHSGRFFTN